MLNSLVADKCRLHLVRISYLLLNNVQEYMHHWLLIAKSSLIMLNVLRKRMVYEINNIALFLKSFQNPTG